MIWEPWQLIILSFINFSAGLYFGYLLKKYMDKIFYKEKLHITPQCAHKSDSKLYTRTCGIKDKDNMIEITYTGYLYRENATRCIECGEFYR